MRFNQVEFGRRLKALRKERGMMSIPHEIAHLNRSN